MHAPEWSGSSEKAACPEVRAGRPGRGGAGDGRASGCRGEGAGRRTARAAKPLRAVLRRRARVSMRVIVRSPRVLIRVVACHHVSSRVIGPTEVRRRARTLEALRRDLAGRDASP